ncbi:MAG: TetR/AcrR family transcriptional regulator [Clostridia bacterium]|nr:TetR/AcrR family transcriptional regulator [Clostridia bacterium]
MPKIIENVRELIIEEARRQIEESGYESVTIRSIARGCKLGLGTFYNYFKSKDVLIATYLLEDWDERLKKINTASDETEDPMQLVKVINEEISGFMQNNVTIFTAHGAIKAFQGSVGDYHKRLIGQISMPLYKVCHRANYENAEFLSEFVAEAVLTWTVAQKSFDDFAPVMSKLFVK